MNTNVVVGSKIYNCTINLKIKIINQTFVGYYRIDNLIDTKCFLDLETIDKN